MKKLIFIFIIATAPSFVFCQHTASNIEVVLSKKDPDNNRFKPRKVEYMFAEKSFLLKYNPISLTFGGLLAFYQKVISQQLASHCPYEISCSEFCKLCIVEYGLIKGTALTADRLTRCTEFTRVDMHPLWLNDNQQIIDPIERYRHHKNHHH